MRFLFDFLRRGSWGSVDISASLTCPHDEKLHGVYLKVYRTVISGVLEFDINFLLYQMRDVDRKKIARIKLSA